MVENKSLDGAHFNPQIWPELTKQYGNGMLIHNPACYGLWFYYGLGYSVYVNKIKDKLLMEGEPEPITNHKQLFSAASMLYGSEPEEMIRFWPMIDAECTRQFIPIMPALYKFNSPIIISRVGPGYIEAT